MSVRERAIVLTNDEGLPVRADVRLPDGDGPFPVVVVLHGFKGFKDWGFFPYACERLAAAGHAVVSFNFSRNGVGPGLQDFDELDKFGSNTLGLEQDELRGILDEVRDGDLLPRRPGRVGVLGHSRGGGQAILAAADHPAVASLVTWNAVSHFDRWSEETQAEWREAGRLWILNQRTGVQMPLDLTLLEDLLANRERLDIPAAAGRIEAPWLIVHGEDDTTVSVREGEALSARSRAARLQRVEGAGHTFEARHPFAATTPQLEAALDATVAHFRTSLGDGRS